MIIDIHTTKQLLSRFMLRAGTTYCVKIADTPTWKEHKRIDCTVQYNGIEMPAEEFDRILHGFLENIEEHYRKEYDAENFDKRVHEAAKELLKKEADNALEVLYNLTNKLQESDDLLKPYWERENKESN